MRVFEVLKEFEWHDGERLVGTYVPGLTYTAFDDEAHTALRNVLDEWVADGRVKIIEQQSGGAQHASVGGQAETI